MTVSLFLTILTAASSITCVATEAIKKAFNNSGKTYSANVIALVNAAIFGCCGTSIVYLLAGIPFTIQNGVCILLMGLAVWLSSMVGYDKVIQLIKQLAEVSGNGQNS